MKKWIACGLIVLMIFFHQDSWLWNDGRLVFGFLPIGLLYHIIYSIAASVVLWILVQLAWPHQLDEIENDPANAAKRGDR